MTAVDRTMAWTAVNDPATSAGELAAIAGAHPEFAATIGRHPNAYPELVAWAQAVAGPGAAVAASAVTAPPQEGGRRSHRLWVAAAVVMLTLELLLALMGVLFDPLLGSMSGVNLPMMGPLTMAIALAAGALPVVASAMSGVSSGRRTGAVILASVALVMVVLANLETLLYFLPYYGVIPSWGLPLPNGGLRAPLYVLLGVVWFTTVLLAWQLSWPLRDRATLALIPAVLVYVAAWLVGSFLGFSLIMGPIGDLVLLVLMAACVLLAYAVGKARTGTPAA